MFQSEPTYTAMECRNDPKDCNATSGTYLLKEEDIDRDSDDEHYLKETASPSRRPGRSLKCILGISAASIFVVGVAVAILVLVVTSLTGNSHNSSPPLTPARLSNPTPVPRCGDTLNAVVCLGEQDGSCNSMLVGNREDEVFVFKGIPYALPPISDRRWKPPVPVRGNNCSVPTYVQMFGKKCLQLGKDDIKIDGSEDCLYLNVWTPSLAATANLDVMVYFHGGGLISGSGSENDTLPTPRLVKAANVVFVTFNYRLGAFGFMAIEAMAVNDTAGNYGFMDQILALQWVHENIGKFGGHPEKVTVFGQGSGATSVYALLTSELAAGLFGKAWLASPSPKLENSLAEAYEQNFNFLNETGCGDQTLGEQILCLHNTSAEKILQAFPWRFWKNLHFYRLPLKTERSAAIAVIDGYVLKSSPLAAWKKKNFNDVPILLGNTAQETDVYPMIEKLVDWSMYDNYVYQMMVPFDHVNISQVLSMYGHTLKPEHSVASLVSDMRAICPVDEMFKVAANASSAPLFRYLASFVPVRKSGSSGIQKNYAYSGLDVETFFDSEGDVSSQNGLTNVMRDIVFEFVRNGTIAGWNRFPRSAYNVSRAVEKVVPRFLSPECNFWRTNWFFPTYAWMN